eukprot:7469-Pleurochrysis_carterae.AAC.1
MSSRRDKQTLVPYHSRREAENAQKGVSRGPWLTSPIFQRGARALARRSRRRQGRRCWLEAETSLTNTRVHLRPSFQGVELPPS